MTPRKSFGSDNHAGTHPDVMRAMVTPTPATRWPTAPTRARTRRSAELKRLSGAEGEAYLVLNGSGANVLGLGLLLGRHEAVICAESAHINTDECGAAERILGTKLLTVPSADGKITPEFIAGGLSGRGDEHFAQPGVVAVTQSTELGTCYSLTELRAIKEFCAANQLRVYLDGARLANAAAFLGCSVAEIASCADVLSFGATKNGAMGVEAVIVMRAADGANARYLRKQHMQLSSKMRFLRRSSTRCSPTTSGCGTPPTPTPWPPGLRTASPPSRGRRGLPGPGGRGLRPPGPPSRRRAAAELDFPRLGRVRLPPSAG